MADLNLTSNLTQVCRICLMEHKDMQLTVDDVVDKLFDCASVQLPPNTLICAFCESEVEKWYAFKQQVIRSTEVIRYIEENRVKKEDSMNQSNFALIEERYIKIEQPETVEVKQETNIDDTSQEEETSHTFQGCCNICGETFSSLLELSIHKQTHPTPEPPEYQCDLCHKSFQSKTGFVWHTKMHSALRLNVSSERFSCPRCPMIYEKKASLVDHLRWKHNHVVKKPKRPQTDPLQCPVCKKKFDSTRGLNLHKNRKAHNDHANAKPPKRIRPKKKRLVSK